MPKPKRQGGFTPAQKLEALVTLIAAGGDRVEDVRILGDDKGLGGLLGGPFPCRLLAMLQARRAS